MTNALARAASPYLRQHQENPVNWVEWSEEAFAQARTENKLVLISSGYAACHWCHVMAHECFEDDQIATIMNREFVCIKVDREERPDVDQIYLDAVQLMSGRGGWPLNCFVLPDGRPVYGGTYFPREHWRALLENLAALHKNEPATIAEQASKITTRLHQNETRGTPTNPRPISWPAVVAAFTARFDTESGGTGHAPKFPMPCEWSFLLRYGTRTGDAALLKQVRLTLDRMARGGIHDQIGGGFSRYSVDESWHVPHFEKMLYDNAQLLELYAEAAVVFDEPAYRTVALGIATFVERELSAGGDLVGGYCSALDADSEGEEGLFYIWTRAELTRVLGERAAPLADLFGVHLDADGGEAHWEHGRHVLIKRFSVGEWAARHAMTPEVAAQVLSDAARDLMAARDERERPMRDDKVLTGWNGLMIAALAHAGRLLNEPELIQRAKRCADLFLSKARRDDGGLWRRGSFGASGQAEAGDEAFGIEAFLEDYACLSRGLIALYQATFEERYLTEAHALARYALNHCSDQTSDANQISPLLFFTADNAPQVLIRKKEIQDNVIPSSNALMTGVLFQLADYFTDPSLHARAVAMGEAMAAELPSYAPAYAYWAHVLFVEAQSPATLAVVGPDAAQFLKAITGQFLPHLRVAGSLGSSTIPLLADKVGDSKTLAFRCEAGTCGLPTTQWQSLVQSELGAWSRPA
jgi:uncharacterized protein YyaL (SSP411 family)